MIQKFSISTLLLLLSLISFVKAQEILNHHDSNYDNRSNGTFYTLCRNSDLYEMLDTIQEYEYRFNSKYHYDWVFLNDDEFTEEFKVLISKSISGNVKFGKIPNEHWSFPEDLDTDKMHSEIAKLTYEYETNDNAPSPYPYYNSISYRKMCRFQSGFFYKHELLLDYKFFWRVEPGVKLYCDINFDIFKEMELNDYKYGFVLSLLEYPRTIPSLFNELKNYLTENNKLNLLKSSENYSKYIIDEFKDDYNLCHFWTNFEIGDLDLLRSNEYNKIFNYLDSKKGYFYERWGDAPVRSLILSLILNKNKNEIKWFNNIGYKHEPYTQCPKDFQFRSDNKCSCDPDLDFSYDWYSCSWYFENITNNSTNILSLSQ
ncbi:hypothetical protein BVG19_g758 [[Candida] boidinii]|nr:hypothetical protein BVG19_g758 [[Candida] boidinii]OWB50770.1 hypothetical protein B5S27_g2323 [[Candida] boidinii]